MPEERTLMNRLRIAKRAAGPARLLRSLRIAATSGTPMVYWSRWGVIDRNWGDALNPVLVEKIAGRPPVHPHDVDNFLQRPVHTVIGSMLGSIAFGNVHVWGSGFSGVDQEVRAKSMTVHAVRGPLTRRKLLEQGIHCPEVFGDPALLLPRYYSPSATKDTGIGIIPHCFDQDHPAIDRLRQDPRARVIDITGDIYEVVEEIARCEFIVSSSLHGIIAADSYGIPSAWLRFTDRPLGDGFKFLDYFESVGRPRLDQYPVTMDTTVDMLLDLRTDYRVSIDLDRLLEACPFRA